MGASLMVPPLFPCDCIFTWFGHQQESYVIRIIVCWFTERNEVHRLNYLETKDFRKAWSLPNFGGFLETAGVRFHQSCVQWVLWLELILDSGPTLWWKPLLLRRDPSNLKWMLCWIRRRKVKIGNGLPTEMKSRCQIQYSDSVLAVADYVSPVVCAIWSLIILEFWERWVYCFLPCRLSPQRFGSWEGKGLYRYPTREDGWYCVVCSEISGKR